MHPSFVRSTSSWPFGLWGEEECTGNLLLFDSCGTAPFNSAQLYAIPFPLCLFSVIGWLFPLFSLNILPRYLCDQQTHLCTMLQALWHVSVILKRVDGEHAHNTH